MGQKRQVNVYNSTYSHTLSHHNVLTYSELHGAEKTGECIRYNITYSHTHSHHNVITYSGLHGAEKTGECIRYNSTYSHTHSHQNVLTYSGLHGAKKTGLGIINNDFQFIWCDSIWARKNIHLRWYRKLYNVRKVSIFAVFLGLLHLYSSLLSLSAITSYRCRKCQFASVVGQLFSQLNCDTTRRRGICLECTPHVQEMLIERVGDIVVVSEDQNTVCFPYVCLPTDWVNTPVTQIHKQSRKQCQL